MHDDENDDGEDEPTMMIFPPSCTSAKWFPFTMAVSLKHHFNCDRGAVSMNEVTVSWAASNLLCDFFLNSLCLFKPHQPTIG